MTFKLKDIHCFIEIMEDGSEAIIQSAHRNPKTNETHVLPLLTGSAKMAEKMKIVAQEHANASHRKVIHVKLSEREEVETIEEKLVKQATPETAAAVTAALGDTTRK